MKVKGKHEFEATPSVNGNAIALANQVSAADHAHGNITNDGKVGSTANLPLITSTDGAVIAGSFGTDANSFCQGNDARLSDARTPTAHNHDASDVNSGTLDAARVPTLDAAKIGSGVLDIARIPAAAIERMVPVADQAARFALTTATVQLGDTVKQLDTGIMYVVIDTANLANAAGYSEYTAATAAAVPWSGVQTKPTTLSGYGITDAATNTHVHGNITTAGAIGSTSGLAVVTGTSGVLTTGTVAVASGGTGATTAATALTNLGITATAAELNILDGVTGVTAAELSYVGDVTSAIQAQLNGKATSTHVHGNITNAGAIGTTASLPVITTTSGVLTTGTFGTAAATFCQGNDTRLSDARTPLAHVHGNISNTGAIGTAAGLAVVTTTSGVLTTGTVAVASGGTGATTAAAALTNLGLTATAAELNYTDGVTSNIQTQLNAKSASTHVHGNITNTGYIGSTAGLPIVTSTSGIVAAGSWYASTPATATTTGAVGSSTSPARGDHAHPSRIAISAPASPVNGDIWMV